MQALKYKHSRRWDSHPVYLKNILRMLHFFHVVFNEGCCFRRQTCHPSFHHLLHLLYNVINTTCSIPQWLLGQDMQESSASP